MQKHKIKKLIAICGLALATIASPSITPISFSDQIYSRFNNYNESNEIVTYSDCNVPIRKSQLRPDDASFSYVS